MTQGEGPTPQGPDDRSDPSGDDAHHRGTRYLWPTLAGVFALVAILLAGILIGGRSNTAGPVSSTTSPQATTRTTASASSPPTTSASLTPEMPSTTTQPTSTGTRTSAAPSTNSSTGGVDSWPLKGVANGYLGVAPSPDFPTALPQWQLHNSWSDNPRVFAGQGTAVSGPGHGTFPSTMNGCDAQRFLLRWRALEASARVDAYLYDAGKNVRKQTTANAGWMDFDGCLTPAFLLSGHTTAPGTEGEGMALTDVAVTVQQYFPAP